ncbi:MAG: DUF4252 domain-containing protein [Tannerellaceae bacterium]|jgi:hypothetical protein|nr:DUF4252 domain-containing protein [Tannerellaceae bacterium]
MKAIYSVLVLSLFCTQLCVAQNKLFNKYADMEGVSSVYISKSMFQMIPDFKDANLDIKDLKEKIESLQILSTQKEEISAQMKKEFTYEYEELMRIKDGDTRTTFYVHKKGNTIKELIMIADGTGSFTVIRLLGSFTVQDVQRITKRFD